MAKYDEDMSEDDDYLDEELMEGLEPRTTESGDLLDDSNPFGYDDMDDSDEYESDEDDDDDY